MSRRDTSAQGREAFLDRARASASPEVRALVAREFPSVLPLYDDAVRRRDFLQLMGATLAIAGLGSCTRQPEEKILPYAKRPEDLLPGQPLDFATAMPLAGAALGLLVRSHEGRPIKVEGNPDHPSSLGATDVFAQAATNALYDPDRSRAVLEAGQISTWDAFHRMLRGALAGDAETGRGVRILTPVVSSPSLAAELRALLARWPEARWIQWEPVNRDGALRAARACFGRPLTTRYRLERADVVVALDADLLGAGPGCVRYARDFAARRRARAGAHAMNRLYAVESTFSVTGAFADHRLPVRPSDVERFARWLARELGADVEADLEPPAAWARFGRALARDLREHAGRALVVAGDAQPADVHALAHWINRELGAVGAALEYAEPVEPEPADCAQGIRELAAEMRAGAVRALFVLGGNPVHDAPADCGFRAAYLQVPLRVHLSLYEDETSRISNWHLPEAHFLESWGDARGHDGTLTPIQPLIAPLFGGRSALEVVADLGGRPMAKGYDLVRARWREVVAEVGEGPEDDAAFEGVWRTALHDGLVKGSASPAVAPDWDGDLSLAPLAPRGEGIELRFRADGCTYDGRFANLGWLQELPRPISRIVWDDAAWIAPETARRLGLEQEQVVSLTAGGATVEAPVWLVPGHPEDCLTLHLGGGRSAGGALATGVGFDAYPLRRSEQLGWAADVTLRATSARALVVSVQDHRRMEGRDILRVRTVDRFDAPREEPHDAQHDAQQEGAAAGAAAAEGHGETSMYPGFEYPGRAWGMVIDLNACIGCNACMVACQAENNVPVVGKDQVAVGREMHWLRVDQYLEGDGADTRVHHQPLPCMHCEEAPCELVCPVGATVHSDEGLNDMVYNRCVGTRYCANNCPYKVRRFNFFNYNLDVGEVERLGENPDVTVRSRGVMEKCTYCVQRINRTRIAAELDGRGIADGEVQTACQQACPTQAIAFGDLNDAAAEVAAQRREPHHYALLGELGTKPRTTYLEKLSNPNPELSGDAPATR